ncbi:MAG: hypothetical protein IKC73_02470 [Clostridia bacterium]|nr:hypothetical protein [Clostridia bacterium]
MATCCVCLHKFEGEEPPILMMNGEGEAMVLCPECAALLDKIAGTEESEERTRAVEALLEMDVQNPTVAAELSRLIRHEDAPLSEEDAFLDEEEVEEMPVANPTTVSGASNLWFYLGAGCLGAAFILFLILRFAL